MCSGGQSPLPGQGAGMVALKRREGSSHVLGRAVALAGPRGPEWVALTRPRKFEFSSVPFCPEPNLAGPISPDLPFFSP